jgi:hypothetical protein
MLELLLDQGDEGDGVNGGEGAAGDCFGSISLPSQSSDYFCVFRVSMPPHREIARGVMHIAGIMSTHIRRATERDKRTHGVESGPHHASRGGVASCTP